MNEKKINGNSAAELTDRIAGTGFLLLTLLLGIMARYYMLPMSSGDQHQFLLPWFDKIDELGAVGTLRDGIGDYMPPYFWIMIIISRLPISNRIYGLKWVSGIADFLSAYFIMKIIRKLTGSETKAEISFAAAFLMPSVMLNSAAWGQCDAIFTMFLVMCVYYLIEGRDIAAMICYSVSFVFKLQAIFLAPLIALMVLKRKIRVRALIAFPVVYLAAILPSAACGHEFSSLFTIYFSQAGQYSSLNMTLPNIWSMVKDVKSEPLGKAGVMFAGVCCMTGIYYLYKRPQTPGVRGTVVLAALSALFVPYLLPYMHERYYFTAAVMSLLLVFLDKRLTPLWLVVEYSSVTSMARFLLGKEEYDLRFTTFFVTAVLVAMFVYYCRLAENDQEIEFVPIKPFFEEDEYEEKPTPAKTNEPEPEAEPEPEKAPAANKPAPSTPGQNSSHRKRGKKRADPIQERHGKGVKL